MADPQDSPTCTWYKPIYRPKLPENEEVWSQMGQEHDQALSPSRSATEKCSFVDFFAGFDTTAVCSCKIHSIQ